MQAAHDRIAAAVASIACEALIVAHRIFALGALAKADIWPLPVRREVAPGMTTSVGQAHVANCQDSFVRPAARCKMHRRDNLTGRRCNVAAGRAGSTCGLHSF